MLLLAGFLPAAVIGLIFNDKIEEKFFDMWPVIIAWVIGIVAAAISAAIAVKWLVSYLQSYGLSVFGWYRIALGLVIGSLIVAGTFRA